MTETSYLGLKKPDPQDYYDVGDWNDNSDTIDQFAEGLAGDGGVLQQMQSAIAALAGGVHLKGAVNYYTDLPATGQSEGDAYTVLYAGTSGADPLGVEYAWATYESTPQWIPLGVDPTYYAKAADLAAQAAALAEVIDNGPKNIFHTAATTETIGEVAFAKNSDGTWTTTATGSTSARRAKAMTFNVPASIPAGRYIITGCPAGGKVGSTIKYCLYLMDSTTGTRVVANDDDTGDGFAFDWTPNPAHTYNLIIDIRAGSNANGLTWKPMICLESAWNISHKFVAYAPTNAELYAMIQAQT